MCDSRIIKCLNSNTRHLLIYFIKYNLDVLVLYMNIYIFCYFILSLGYIFEANVVFYSTAFIG